MTYAFKLSQRLARFRVASLGLATAVLSTSCTQDNLNGPDTTPAAGGSQGVVISPDSTTLGVDQSMQFFAFTDSSGAVSFKRGQGGGHGHNNSRIVSLSVSPPATTLATGTQVDYSATAVLSDGSTTRPALTWTATGGTVDTAGVFTAGKAPGKYHVIATASGGVSDTAAVTVTDTVPVLARVTLTPGAATVAVGGAQQFSLTGVATDGSTVGVAPVYTASGGMISSTGRFVAGQSAGTFRVIAKDSASGLADTAAVTITAPDVTLQSLVVSPASVSLNGGASQQFAAVGKMSDGSTKSVAVTWTASGGTISSSGLYVAASTSGTYRVVASASGKADTASVDVLASSPAPGCTGVPIAAGQSIQAAVNANPGATTFCLGAGTWTGQSVVPKSGDQFIGQGKGVTVLDGQNTTPYAFDAMATSPRPSSVVIRNFTITRYKPALQSGMIRGGDAPTDGGTGWTVRDMELSYSVTGGLRLGPRMQVIGNNIHHNRAIGMVGTGADILVESNEIAWNNYLKEYSWGAEAGGTKFATTTNIVVRNNYSHDNWGPGLWTDINNRGALYEGNRVEDNAGPGIYHEISYDAVIRNNVIKRNGFDFAGWIWGGGIQISTSQNVEIYGNTLEGNKVGVSIVQQDRGYDWATRNINVHDNVVTQRTGTPAGAAIADTGDHNVFYAGIKFDRNSYRVTSSNQSSFEWWDGCCRSWSQWKAYGLDVNGSLTVIP